MNRQELVASEKPRVRLALPSGFAALVTAHLTQLRREYPGISLELLSGSRPVDVKKGEAELALRIGPVADQDLVAQKMGEVGWSLYAADSYLARRSARSTRTRLAGHEVIGYDDCLGAVPGATWLEAHGADATVVLRCREMTDMLATAAAGLGMAVLPCMLGETEPALKRLTDEMLGSRKLSLVYRREMLRVAAVRAVISFVVMVMRKHADRICGIGVCSPMLGNNAEEPHLVSPKF